jgi:hypothetical protein
MYAQIMLEIFIGYLNIYIYILIGIIYKISWKNGSKKKLQFENNLIIKYIRFYKEHNDKMHNIYYI